MRHPRDYGPAVEAWALACGLARFGIVAGGEALWSADGSRLVWSSAPSGSGMPAVGTPPDADLQRSLKALADGLRPGTVRIEKLRFSPDRLLAAKTCACGLLFVGAESFVVTAVIGAPSGRSAHRAPGNAAAKPAAERGSQTESAPAASPPGSAAAEARLAGMRERGRQRFVWQADAQGRFTFVSDTLADVVGPAMAAIIGRTWDEIARALVIDPDGEVSRLFARHETWSGRTVLWRIEDTDHAVPVDLAGIPAIGAEREILGFRGFGVCRTEAPTLVSAIGAGGPPKASDPERRDSSAEDEMHACAPVPDTEPRPSDEEPASVEPPARADAERPAEPTAHSPNPSESGMDQAMLAAGTETSFGSIRTRASAKLGLPRPVPLRVVEGRPNPALDPKPRDHPPEAEARDPEARAAGGRLSAAERNAFREIARALSTRAEPQAPVGEPDPPLPAPVVQPPPAGESLAEQQPGHGDALARLGELSAILDTVTDGILLIDGSMHVLSLNRSAEALFGFDQSEVVGQRVTTLFAPESHAVFLDYFAGLQREGVGSVFNDGRALTGRVRQGGTFPLAMTIGRIGEPATERFCVVLRDVTHQARTEGDRDDARALAAQADGERADFLAKISHEIRTPMNSVIGFAEIMLDERFGPIGSERYRDYLRDIRQAGTQVVGLVDGLLNLARIESGRFSLSFTGVSLNKIVSGCVELSQAQAMRGRIVLRTSFADRLPTVIADENSVRQIVQNLLANAVSFTQPGGQVIVSTAVTERGELAFRVRDTGIGMSRGEIEAALEPLRNLSGRRGAGPGLGLPITKALVAANLAELQITSAPQQGTLVEVMFPANRVLAL